LKDPEVKREYDALALRFEVISLLIRVRSEYGLTQKELAEKVGMKQSAIARLESGNHNPSLAMLRRIADALDVSFTLNVGRPNASRVIELTH
jgi:transcriptional regulator with XRE-family HTH domain